VGGGYPENLDLIPYATQNIFITGMSSLGRERIGSKKEDSNRFKIKAPYNGKGGNREAGGMGRTQ